MSVKFEHPSNIVVLNTLTLPNPDFDNTIEISPRRIAIESRDKTPIVYRDNNWIAPKTFKMKFTNLEDDKIDEVVDFLELTLGEMVWYTDYEGNQWPGIIVDPNGVMSEARGMCGEEIELTFEVVVE